MKLEGKLKKDFFDFRYKGVKWKEEDTEMFYEDPLLEQQAWIVQFFDSVGLYILPQFWETTMKWNYRISDKYSSDFNFNSRQKATEKAIEHTNKIYNESKR